ncbi:zinc dependent phospholipase C family protein [Candidatus Neomarinimicrobiota bacterium]
MRRIAVQIIIIQLTFTVTQLFGWGYDVHRRITRSAVQAVHGEFGDFLIQNIEDLSYHAADPDFWKAADPNEGYRHFIDADLYDEYPFDNIPRNIDSLYSKYGEANISNFGIAPWNIDDYCNRLTELFSAGQWEESIYKMAALSHYVADIHMPLHTCANYNGQLTGNKGVHFHWETPMVMQYVTYIEPLNKAVVFSSPLEMAFEIVKESYELYPLLISADSLARAPLTKIQADSLNTYEKLSFEDEYLSVLYAQTSEVVHDRLNKSAERIASYWYTCWAKAGSPAISKK